MTLAGFPHWEIEFNNDAQLIDPAAVDSLIAESRGLTDLLVFSHGWNNDPPTARKLYKRFFEQVRAVLNARGTAPGVNIGTAGVLWPSTLWPDDEPDSESGGAASAAGPSATSPVAALSTVYKEPDEQAALTELMQLLEDRPKDRAALDRVQQLMRVLSPASEGSEDDAEQTLLTAPAEEVFNKMAAVAPQPPRRATAGALTDNWRRLWSGAKEAARVSTYWRMKRRAGEVGEHGLAKVLQRLPSNVRVHLLGHSFGARLVSFTLKGLPANATQVKSLTLIQGAFSHFAFAGALPHDASRGGALASMAARVDGPILVTFSKFDKAVCVRYPQAGWVSRDDAAMSQENLVRFGAMGSNGARAVPSTTLKFKPVGTPYNFQKGTFHNLNGNDLIRIGAGVSGAHSDIYYPEIAWAVLQATKISS